MTTKLLRDDIEYIIHCDAGGKIIGPISKTHAHLPGVRPTLTHYSSWSMIYHVSTGKYGLQRKNPNKLDKNSAGKWDMGVAGHNCYILEDGGYRPLGFNENLPKEAEEEIGITLQMCSSREEFINTMNKPSDKAFGYLFEEFLYKTEINNEWVGLSFVVVPTTDVSFIDDEVVDFKWLSPEELSEYLKTHDDFCIALPLAFEKAEGFRESILSNKK